MKRVFSLLLIFAFCITAALTFAACDTEDQPVDGDVPVSADVTDPDHIPEATSPVVSNDSIDTMPDDLVTDPEPQVTDQSVETVPTVTTPEPETTPEPVATTEPTTTPAETTKKTEATTKKTESTTKKTEAPTTTQDPDEPVEGSRLKDDVDDEDLDIDIGWEDVNPDELEMLEGGNDGNINVNE